MRWYTSIIPKCGKLRQEDHSEFVISLGYIVNAKPVRAKNQPKKANKQQQQNDPERAENAAQW